MNYQPLNPINLDSLRWAQEKQLLELHRELTQNLRYLKNVRMEDSRTYAQTLQQRADVEKNLASMENIYGQR